ncbi:MAG TPA: SPOR domain-containing protein [Prolixibacteraceae bacterium]|nr:SPOR domain-containing protein [Prolixibacteraceae bacterium]
MKKILFATLAIGIIFSGCKSKKEVASSPYTTDPTNQPKVFSVPASDTKTEPEAKVETPVEDTEPIAMRKEQVTFTSQEDKSKNEINSYFVIIGSFSQLENAKNYRQTLMDQGFTPIILHSETGYYRVCVNSHKNEAEARSRVSQIRQAFPQYSDVWLLIKE